MAEKIQITKGKTVSDLMEEDKKNNQSLVYPIEHEDRYSASITFQPYEITPPTVSESVSETVAGGLSDGLEKAQTQGVGSLFEGFNPLQGFLNGVSAIGDFSVDVWDGKVTAESVAQGADNLYKSVLESDEVPTVLTKRDVKIKGGSVKLFLPTALTFNDGLNYDTPNLGMTGALTFGAVGSGEGALRAGVDAFSKGITSLVDTVTGNTTGADATTLGAIRLANKASPEIAEGISIAGAVTMNPNTRAAFKGVAIREFSFTFKFIPKSKEESKVVEDIIKRFRIAAYPESITAGGIDYGFKFPDLFDIIVKYKTPDGRDVTVGQKFQKCFLKGISTTYNPSTMTFHKDGTPAEIDLTLNFVEEKTLDRAAILEQYSEGSL
jgi:hypothetical protein